VSAQKICIKITVIVILHTHTLLKDAEIRKHYWDLTSFQM
jgi:hypothetical protein